MDITPPASGHAARPQEITPADVLARVNFTAKQLDLIRTQLALPVANEMSINIDNAQPREVYFQALSAYRRVSRFTFEQLRVFHPDPVTGSQVNASSKLPYHVWLLLSRSSNQLKQISTALNISAQAEESVVNKETSPSDVFAALIKVNRQLDIMLQQPFSPSDVFQQVTLGIHYSAKLLSKYPVLERKPEPPAFIEGKQPSDVWLLLVDCLAVIREITESRDEDILSINVETFDASSIRPGDVYQIASIMVSELAYLHSIETDIPPVVATVKVSNKLPSDVYQRVGLLLKQLQQLKTLSSNNSGLE